MIKSYARWSVNIKGDFAKSPRLTEILEAGIHWIAERGAFSKLDKDVLDKKKRSEVLYDASLNKVIAATLKDALVAFVPDVSIEVGEYVPSTGETKGVAIAKAKQIQLVEMLSAIHPTADKETLEGIAKLGLEKGMSMSDILKLTQQSTDENA